MFDILRFEPLRDERGQRLNPGKSLDDACCLSCCYVFASDRSPPPMCSSQPEELPLATPDKSQAQFLAQLLAELAELRASEEKWRSLVRGAPGFIAIAGRDGTMQFLNHTQPGFTMESIAGKSIYDFMLPEFHERARACLEQVFRTGTSASYETLAAGPCGRNAWYETHVGPVECQGQVVAVALFSNDITLRREAERTLQQAHNTLEQKVELRTRELVQANQQLNEEVAARKQSEARYRLLVETTNDLIWEIDQEGAYTYLSPHVKDWLGYEVEELLGHRPFELMPGDEARHLHALFLEKLASGEGVLELEVISLHRSGHRVIHEVNASPVFDATGACRGFRGTSRDITERKRIAQLLRQNHEELQLIYDRMVDGLLIADVETKRFVRANQAICRMLGYTESEMLSRSVLDIHPPEHLPEILEHFMAQATGTLQVAADLPVLRRDGSVFFADITTNHLLYQGRPCNIGFFRDITERKEAAEQLRREHEMLRELLKSHDRERQIIAYEIHDGLAQQLVAAIMQFESSLRLEKLRPDRSPRTGDVVLELLRQCLAETRRLIGGLRPPILDQFGVVPALQNLATESREHWGVDVVFQHNVGFDRLEPMLENAIFRIAQEGLANACRHSQSTRVELGLTQQENLVHVCVRDWGIGFDPERVNERCFGLAGIRERARLLGGKVTVVTQPQAGSQVSVELPLSAIDPE